jgi:hypothetical protein
VRRRPGPFASLALVAGLAAVLVPACSLGEGTGTVSGTLDVPQCWSGPFDLKPDFFAAVPSSLDALQLRIQHGGDYQTFSDGLAILIDDAGRVRGDPLPDGTSRPSLLGQPLGVAIAPGVTPPGVPVEPVAHPAIVHATMYLGRTCRTQNVALYAADAVSLNPDGSCGRPDGGEPPLACGTPAIVSDAGADGSTEGGGTADGGVGATGPSGASTIVFDSLFDGNLDESDAKQRLTDAHFDLYLVDPREICPGGLGPPPRCRGHLTGNFKFYFQRGRPAQPFP